MKQREPLMDAAYFDQLIELRKNSAVRFELVIEKPETTSEHRSNLLHRLSMQSHQTLLAGYSRGQPISALAASFPAVVTALERYLVAAGAERISFESIDHYVEALWLVSLAIVFDADAALFDRLLMAIGNDGADMLFERLVATRVPARLPAERLLWPKPYEALYAATSAPPEVAPALIQKFLKTWYPSLQNCYWYDCHKGPKGVVSLATGASKRRASSRRSASMINHSRRALIIQATSFTKPGNGPDPAGHDPWKARLPLQYQTVWSGLIACRWVIPATSSRSARVYWKCASIMALATEPTSLVMARSRSCCSPEATSAPRLET